MTKWKHSHGDLFPDLRRKSDERFREAIDYRFRMNISQQLGEGAQGKALHSLRHYVATQLDRLLNVKDQTRADILGQTGSTITSQRYT